MTSLNRIDEHGVCPTSSCFSTKILLSPFGIELMDLVSVEAATAEQGWITSGRVFRRRGGGGRCAMCCSCCCDCWCAMLRGYVALMKELPVIGKLRFLS